MDGMVGCIASAAASSPRAAWVRRSVSLLGGGGYKQVPAAPLPASPRSATCSARTPKLPFQHEGGGMTHVYVKKVPVAKQVTGQTSPKRPTHPTPGQV
jgi:hypothetical protein